MSKLRKLHTALGSGADRVCLTSGFRCCWFGGKDAQRANTYGMERLINEIETHQEEPGVRNAELCGTKGEQQNERLRRATLRIGRDRAWYSDLYEFAPVGYFALTKEGLILQANLTGAALLGVDRLLLLRKPLSQFVAREDERVFDQHRRQVLETKQGQSCEIKLLKNDGSHFLTHMASIVIPDRKTGSELWGTAITDLTGRKRVEGALQKKCEFLDQQVSRQIIELADSNRQVRKEIANRKHMEEALLERKAFLRSIIETTLDAIITIDNRGVIEFFSSAAERMFGFTASEVLGRRINMLVPLADSKKCENWLSRHLNSAKERTVRVDRALVGQKKDGSTFPIEISIGEFHADGKRHFTGVVRDVMERQQTDRQMRILQAELLRASSLSTMWETASALTHELVQPLTAIMNYTEACRRMLKKSEGRVSETTYEVSETTYDWMEKAIKEAGRASQVVRRLRRLVEKGEAERSVEDINEVVTEASGLASVGAMEVGISLDLDLDSSLPPVFVDKIQIQQVILNLVRNSIEALVGAEERKITVKTSRAEADAIEVAVRDTGRGFSALDAERLFRPVWSKKAQGMRTGLLICRSVVNAHSGRLWATSNRRGGATYHFTLPIALNPHFPDDPDIRCRERAILL